MKRRLLRPAIALVFSLVFLLTCMAPVAFASEGGGDPVFTPAGMLFRWINSLIILGGIGWGFMKLKGAFRERAVAISTAINQAAIAKKESERRMQDVERKFARLDEEIAGFREAAKRDAALEAEKIRKQAAEEVEKVERAALAEIAASERVARTELRAKAARLAVERAEALIRKQMTADAQSKLLNGFVAELARSVN